jgi:tetratricopeptide (TPR) repeat protein
MWWLATRMTWLASVPLSFFLMIHAIPNVWIEKRLAAVGLPQPGTYLTTVGTLDVETLGLDDYRLALRGILRRRPNWSEGYVRLGLVNLGLYRQLTQKWLEESGADLDDINRMSDPLWLLGTLHENPKGPTASTGDEDLLSAEPVTNHLIPAAHCFLEARRCSPFLALPHGALAALHDLLERGDAPSTYIARSLSLAGNDTRLLGYLAEVALQTGDHKLAARCWQRSLQVDPSAWIGIADAARAMLSSEEILNEVATDAFDAIRFADRLYSNAEERAVRDRFFQFAVDRCAGAHETMTPEQLFLEGHALASLNQSEQAGKQMEKALALRPAQTDWRNEYIKWLLEWGRAEEAHSQALKGLYFAPDSQSMRDAVDRTAGALARGAVPSGSE